MGSVHVAVLPVFAYLYSNMLKFNTLSSMQYDCGLDTTCIPCDIDIDMRCVVRFGLLCYNMAKTSCYQKHLCAFIYGPLRTDEVEQYNTKRTIS